MCRRCVWHFLGADVDVEDDVGAEVSVCSSGKKRVIVVITIAAARRNEHSIREEYRYCSADSLTTTSWGRGHAATPETCCSPDR